MKIAFIFPSEFHILSVWERPLGGSESAVTYLALELARLGMEVDLISKHPTPLSAGGVRGLPFQVRGGEVDFPREFLEKSYDVIILKNGLPELGGLLRQHLKGQPYLYFWTGHATDQAAIQGLKNPDIQKAFDKIVAVSDWHRHSMIQHFHLNPEQVVTIRNAIAPCFEGLFVTDQELLQAKAKSIHCCYTSTPFRGLEILLQVFPKLKEKQPTVELDVYSSMQVYGVAKEEDPFQNLYQNSTDQEGVRYHGSLLQMQLASQLRDHHILAYPNIFPETSCIAVMEAMAAGLWVVTTNLAALPETTLGLGRLVEPHRLLSDEAHGFLQECSDACERVIQSGFHEELFEQVKRINQGHTWKMRARDWLRIFQQTYTEKGERSGKYKTGSA